MCLASYLPSVVFQTWIEMEITPCGSKLEESPSPLLIHDQHAIPTHGSRAALANYICPFCSHIAFRMAPGDMGSRVIRTPMAWEMALARAARGGDDGHLSHAPQPKGVAGIGHLDQHRLDHRRVQGGGHAIVQEAGVGHGAIRGIDILLVQGPADTLDGGALDLPLHVARVDGLAGVYDGGVAQNGHLPRLRVHR